LLSPHDAGHGLQLVTISDAADALIIGRQGRQVEWEGTGDDRQGGRNQGGHRGDGPGGWHRQALTTEQPTAAARPQSPTIRHPKKGTNAAAELLRHLDPILQNPRR
jgi:hypothetical protein